MDMKHVEGGYPTDYKVWETSVNTGLLSFWRQGLDQVIPSLGALRNGVLNVFQSLLVTQGLGTTLYPNDTYHADPKYMHDYAVMDHQAIHQAQENKFRGIKPFSPLIHKWTNLNYLSTMG